MDSPFSQLISSMMTALAVFHYQRLNAALCGTDFFSPGVNCTFVYFFIFYVDVHTVELEPETGHRCCVFDLSDLAFLTCFKYFTN